MSRNELAPTALANQSNSPILLARDLAQIVASVQTGMMSGELLDCLKCPSLCCRMAGYVEVSRNDIRRLAKFLGLTVRAFEERHIVERTRKGSKRIKTGTGTCQFLGADRRWTSTRDGRAIAVAMSAGTRTTTRSFRPHASSRCRWRSCASWTRKS